jgi:ATP synthase protein I
MHQPAALQAKRILVAQFALTLILPAAAIPFGAHVALSALIGAAVSMLATAVFAARVFRRYDARRLDVLVMRFYWAELVKLIVVLSLFVLAFVAVDGLNVPALLTAYLVVRVLLAVLAPDWGAGSKPQR